MSEPVSFDQLATQMSTEVYQQLKTAIEIGRWANGDKLTEQQQQLSLQAILRYEMEHLPPEQRTGYIPPKPSACESPPDSAPLRWKN